MKISDYGFISDCQSGALVGRDGSIDWYCVTRFDSPSVFGRLLDPDAGHWRIGPLDEFTTSRVYVRDSLVLKTIFKTSSGSVELTDVLAQAHGARGHEIGMQAPHILIRRVRGLSGSVEMEMDYAPRFDYGRAQGRMEQADGFLKMAAGPVELWLNSPLELEGEAGGARLRFRLIMGQQLGFSLVCRAAGDGPPLGSRGRLPELDAGRTIDGTIKTWRSWMEPHDTYKGLYPDKVRLGAVVLQGLTYQPTGAVVAAATTSLPEIPGGAANWDYRFSWLRDASMMMNALWVAACPDEPERFFEWIKRSSGRRGRETVQIMYGVAGERELTEVELGHLCGYEDSRPVRIGNAAWKQKQLDVLGEVLDTAFLLRHRLGDVFHQTIREMLINYADRAAASWREPDAGMWEARDRERHYLSSKVMCWVALDRAVRLAGRLKAEDRRDRWAVAREEVRREILEKGWNEEAQAFTGAFGSDHLDASVLLMPVVGFLPATDVRMRATIEAVAGRLGSEETGLVRRWVEEPNGFIICSYWLAECLALAGETERATRIFRRVSGLANDLGLLSEEAHAISGELLGNFPQAFSHVGQINAAWRLTEETTGGTKEEGVI